MGSATLTHRENPRQTGRVVLLTCALAVLCLLHSIRAQAEFGAQPRYVIQSWTVSQGLPQNSVLSLCRTRDGFLWVGTLGGLAQFDGVRFRVFRSIDGNTIPTDGIKYLAEDSTGLLWIGSSRTLTTYRDGVFTAFNGSPAFLHEGLVDFKADSEGNLWAANRQGQVLLIHGAVSRLINAPAEVTSLTVNPAGGVWAASRKGFFGLTSAEVKAVVWAGAHAFNQIYANKENTVIARSGSDTYVLKGGVLGAWPGFHKLWHAAADGANGSIWVTWDAGLALVKDGVTMRQMAPKQGLAEADVESLLEDGEGGIWAGEYTSGLQHLYPGIFSTFDDRDGLPAAPYDMVGADQSGGVWVGSNAGEGDRSRGFLARITRAGLRSYGTRDGLTGDQGMGLVSTPDGAMTIALAPTGLFKFEAGRFHQFLKSPAGTYPTGLLKDHLGNLWFSLHGGALHELRTDGTERVFNEKSGLLDNSIWSLTEDRDGSVWVASSKGVGVLRAQGKERIESFPLGFIGSVFADPDGGVWLGSFQGLRFYDGHSFRQLTQKDGLPSDTVISMAKDAQGNLWAGSANGIFLLRSDEIKRWRKGEAFKFHVRVFGTDDGLLSSQVIDVGQNTLTATQDHRLWFATTKGLSVVDPASLHDKPLQAYIQQVSVDGVRQTDAHFEVKPGHHTLKIEYSAPQMIDPSRVVFAYKMDGWDKDWVKAGGSREVSYAGLPPGRFAFHVRAEYADLPDSVSTAGISLRVRPYFYQTRWFVLLLGAAIAYLIWLLLRARIHISERRLEVLYQARLDERNLIARRLHDTLIQEVVGTALGLEVLSDRLPAESVQERHELDSAVESLQSVIRRGRSALVELRGEEPIGGDLALGLRQAQQELWSGPTPAFDLEVTGVSPAFLEPIYEDVYNIAREALINAFRHSGASRIHISIRFNAASMEVRIDDDGRGVSEQIAASGRPGHFGLKMMKERAVKLHGDLSIFSTSRGTSVILLLTVRRKRWWLRRAGNFDALFPAMEPQTDAEMEAIEDNELEETRGER